MTVRLLLSVLFASVLRRERDQLQLTDRGGFRAYLAHEVTKLEVVLERRTISGAEFHASRKVAGLLVSFYDTLRTIRPAEEQYRMSRVLAAINGLMGNLHDQLVERRALGLQDYQRDQFQLPADIRDRIGKLVELDRFSGL
jgi:hypothetical protein